MLQGIVSMYTVKHLDLALIMDRSCVANYGTTKTSQQTQRPKMINQPLLRNERVNFNFQSCAAPTLRGDDLKPLLLVEVMGYQFLLVSVAPYCHSRARTVETLLSS